MKEILFDCNIEEHCYIGADYYKSPVKIDVFKDFLLNIENEKKEKGEKEKRKIKLYSKKYECYFINTLPHRDDGPAIIVYGNKKEENIEIWYQYGKLHRLNGPAVIDPKQLKWYKNDKLHRIDSPAHIFVEIYDEEKHKDDYKIIKTEIICNVKYAIFGEQWYQNDKLHRIGGPAKISSNDNYIMIKYLYPSIDLKSNNKRLYEEWYQNGELHRDDGPAINENNYGDEEWYQYGKLHRDDGPAIYNEEYQHEVWYQNGIEYTKKQVVKMKEMRKKITKKYLRYWYDKTYENINGEAYKSRMNRDMKYLENEIGFVFNNIKNE